MLARKTNLFPDGDNGRKFFIDILQILLTMVHNLWVLVYVPIQMSLNYSDIFRSSVMIPIKEKHFYMCVDQKFTDATHASIMMYIRGTYQSQKFPTLPAK